MKSQNYFRCLLFCGKVINWRFWKPLCFTIGGIIIARNIYGYWKEKKLRNQWNQAGKDVVVLHQFWKGKLCPCLSPFVIKVECFLRLSGIKYIQDFQKPFGANNLCPWITINGRDIADSQVIIESLVQHFSSDLDGHLSFDRIVALDTARIMMEEQIFWVLYLARYYFDESKNFVTTQQFPRTYLKYFFLYVMPRKSYQRAKHQGMTAHSKERQFELLKKAILYLDFLLGDEPYFGGAKPCTFDCALFGMLIQLKWNCPGTEFQKLVTESYPRLDKYCLTMKRTIYPDWNQILFPSLESEKSLALEES